MTPRFHVFKVNAIRIPTFLLEYFPDSSRTVRKRNARTTLDSQLRDRGCQVGKAVYMNGHFKSYESSRSWSSRICEHILLLMAVQHATRRSKSLPFPKAPRLWETAVFVFPFSEELRSVSVLNYRVHMFPFSMNS